MQIQRQAEIFLLSPYPKLMKCMVDYEVQKSSLHWVCEVVITTSVYQKVQKQKLLLLHHCTITSSKQYLLV